MNTHEMPTHTWKILSFLALNFDEQSKALANQLVDEDYLNKEDWDSLFGDKFSRHSDESQHLIQVICMFVYAEAREEVFLESHALIELYKKSTEALIPKKYFLSEIPFEHSQIFSMKQLKFSGVWDEVRQLARQALTELELYPLEINKPIKLDYR